MKTKISIGAVIALMILVYIFRDKIKALLPAYPKVGNDPTKAKSTDQPKTEPKQQTKTSPNAGKPDARTVLRNGTWYTPDEIQKMDAIAAKQKQSIEKLNVDMGKELIDIANGIAREAFMALVKDEVKIWRYAETLRKKGNWANSIKKIDSYIKLYHRESLDTALSKIFTDSEKKIWDAILAGKAVQSVPTGFTLEKSQYYNNATAVNAIKMSY